MKRILLLLLVILFTGINFCYAQNKVEFIYINGSNNNNIKMTKWFHKGISKFHPILRETLLEDEFIQEKLLNNSKYTISIEPQILFWGQYSKNNLESLKEDLSTIEKYSPRVAQRFRELFAYCIYDAIWVSKYSNMRPIVNELHKKIMQNYKNGNQTVVLGYSAGTFISYTYFIERLPVISKERLSKFLTLSPQNKKILDEAEFNDTCIRAMEESRIYLYNSSDDMIAFSSPEIFSRNLGRLNDKTQQYCTPKNALRGIINYASPLPLFFDDLSDPKHRLSMLKTYVYQYVIENNLFYTTVNFAEDPMGYPLGKNLTLKEIKRDYNANLEGNGGFLYDKSDMKSEHTFILAHTSYWSSSKKFAKGILSAYKDGYKHFYSLP